MTTQELRRALGLLRKYGEGEVFAECERGYGDSIFIFVDNARLVHPQWGDLPTGDVNKLLEWGWEWVEAESAWRHRI